MTTYLEPIPYDVPINRNTYLKTVSFETRFFRIGTKRYEILCTSVQGDDSLHTIRNVETNDTRDVLGSAIRKWLDNSQT